MRFDALRPPPHSPTVLWSAPLEPTHICSFHFHAKSQSRTHTQPDCLDPAFVMVDFGGPTLFNEVVMVQHWNVAAPRSYCGHKVEVRREDAGRRAEWEEVACPRYLGPLEGEATASPPCSSSRGIPPSRERSRRPAKWSNLLPRRSSTVRMCSRAVVPCERSKR